MSSDEPSSQNITDWETEPAAVTTLVREDREVILLKVQAEVERENREHEQKLNRENREHWLGLVFQVSGKVIALALLGAILYGTWGFRASTSPEAQRLAFAVLSALVSGTLGYVLGKSR